MPERVLKDLLPKAPKGWYWETGFKRSASAVVKGDFRDALTIRMVSLWHLKEYKRDFPFTRGGTRKSIQEITEELVGSAMNILVEFEIDHSKKVKVRKVKEKRAEISSLIGSWR